MWWFDQDHHMLVCHTADLLRAHSDLSMRGIFSTSSKGVDQEDQNCLSGDTEIITRTGIF